LTVVALPPLGETRIDEGAQGVVVHSVHFEIADVAEQQLDMPPQSRRRALVLGFAQKALRAIGEEGAGVHAPLALPLDPGDLLREIALCVLLRHGSEAREDALTPVRLVDRAPAETIDRDPVYVCPRHATPPVVMDLRPGADSE
jgi:hypothetical protein